MTAVPSPSCVSVRRVVSRCRAISAWSRTWSGPRRRETSDLHQAQVHPVVQGGEERRAAAHQDRVGDDHLLVDQAGPHGRRGECGTADVHRAVVVGLEPAGRRSTSASSPSPTVCARTSPGPSPPPGRTTIATARRSFGSSRSHRRARRCSRTRSGSWRRSGCARRQLPVSR